MSLVDERGAAAGSALTGADGAYVLRTAIPGTYLLRVERIGYESWSSESFALGRGASITRRLEIPIRAVRLDELAVTVEGHCAPRPGAGPEMARAWEEARKALEVTRWTEEESAIGLELRRWDREIDPRSGRVRREETLSAERRAWRTFVSAPAGELSREGYVRRLEDDGGWRFYAPDAEVLLSDTFADDHCFSLVRGRGDEEGLVGLHFEPAPGRSAPEVRGTLWIEAASAELRHLSFEYVNTDLDRALRGFPAGGHVEFARLPAGHWFVRRWYIRMPVAGERTGVALAEGPGGGPFQPRRETVLAQVREAGGEVVRVELPGGEMLPLAEWGAVAGVVTDGTGDAAAAEIELAGTGYRGRTDSDGRFRIEPVPRGEYTLVARHPDAALLGVPGVEAPVTVGTDREAVVAVVLQPMDAAYGEMCVPPDETPLKEVPAGQAPRRAAAFGIVRDGATGEPVPGASVWLADPEWVVRRAAAVRGTWRVEADSAGVYLACGLPGGADLLAQAGTATAASDTARGSTRPGRLLRLDFDLVDGRRPLARFAGEPDLDAVVDEILAAGAEEEDTGRATLVGTVRSVETGEPVSGARVRLLGRDEERLTGAEGTFVFSGLPRGRYRVVTERLGLASDTAEVDVRLGAGTMASLMLETRPVELPTLEVEIERTFRSHRLAGFYDRMSRGLGDFVTAEDLEARDVISNFRRIPNVRIEQCVTPRGLRVASCWDLKIARGHGLDPTGSCPPLVYVDGHLLTAQLQDSAELWGGNPINLLQNLPRHRLEGIEVYRSPAAAPAQYRMLGDACGIILVWTRGR